MTRRVIFLFAALLIGCAHAAPPQGEPSAPPSGRPSIAPEDGARALAAWLTEPLVLDVRSTGHHEQGGQRTDGWDMSGRLTLRASLTGDPVRVSQAFTGFSGQMAPATFAKQYLVHLVPTLVLSPAGELVAIEGQEEARAAGRDTVARLPGDPAGGAATWEAELTDEGLAAFATEWWHTMFETGAAVLEPGAVHEWTDESGRAPDGTPVVLRYRLTATRDDACGVPSGCIRHTMRIEADPEATLALVRATAPEGPLQVDRYEVRDVVELVLELPSRALRSYATTRTIETGLVHVPTGDRGETVDRVERTYTAVR